MRSCFALMLLVVVAAPAAAQDPRLPPRSSPDFLFAQPRASVTLRGSWLFARGDSDWYAFVTRHLTLDSADFNAPGIGLDIGVPLNRRMEAQFALDFSRRTKVSEYRDWVDNNRLPIEQSTTLRQVNLSGNIKFALADRGRQVGSFVWVPRRIVPYVGAGAGLLSYDLQQVGDFVDFVTLDVFSDVFLSSGWSPSATAFAGVDVRVLKHVAVTFDGRYLWADHELGLDWVGFEPIDLAGFRLSGGVNVTF